MSLSVKREVSHDPRQIEPGQRRYGRLNRNHPGSHYRKSSTSTEAKSLKIVKSSSSTEKPELKTLYSHHKVSPKVIKFYGDSVTLNLNHQLKYPFGVHQTRPQELKGCSMQ
jgi:hypothetical protein